MRVKRGGRAARRGRSRRPPGAVIDEYGFHEGVALMRASNTLDSMRVLLVEDDARVAAALAAALRRNGYTVVHAPTGAAALTAATPEVVLLDLTLPDIDGIEVMRGLRRRGEPLAIIVVTGRSGEEERVAGLYAGADDYLVKPFSIIELQARIEAVTRRTARATFQPKTIISGPISIDIGAGRVICANREVALTRKETQILTVLASSRGAVVTYERLMLTVWQTSWVGRHTLDVHVGSLRAKLGAPDLVQTVRGVGYRLRAS